MLKKQAFEKVGMENLFNLIYTLTAAFMMKKKWLKEILRNFGSLILLKLLIPYFK